MKKLFKLAMVFATASCATTSDPSVEPGATSAPPIPAGMSLPSGDGSPCPDNTTAPVVAVTDDAVLVNGEKVGVPLNPDAAQAAGQALINASSLAGRDGAWPVLALAMDGQTDLVRTRSVVDWLQRAGAEKVFLMMSSGCARVALVPEVPAPGDISSKPPLNLTMALDAGVVTISASGGVLEPVAAAAPTANIDRDALKARFVDIKKTFPDERQVFVVAKQGKLQDVVDAAGAVRTMDAHGTAMFDEVLWLTSQE